MQSSPAVQIEFTSDSVKAERRSYARSIIQPYRSGVLSKEYLDIYGTKHIKPSAQEIQQAKPVWRDAFSTNFDLAKTK